MVGGDGPWWGGMGEAEGPFPRPGALFFPRTSSFCSSQTQSGTATANPTRYTVATSGRIQRRQFPQVQGMVMLAQTRRRGGWKKGEAACPQRHLGGVETGRRVKNWPGGPRRCIAAGCLQPPPSAAIRRSPPSCPAAAPREQKQDALPFPSSPRTETSAGLLPPPSPPHPRPAPKKTARSSTSGSLA